MLKEESERQNLQPVVPLRKIAMPDVLRTVGLGALVAWQFMMFFSLTPYLSPDHGPEFALDVSYCLVALAQIITFAASMRLSHFVRALAGCRLGGAAAAVLLPASTVLLGLAGTQQDSAIPLYVVGGIVAGAVSALMFLLYGLLFCSASLRAVLMSSCVSFCLAGVLFAAFSPFFGIQALACVAAVAAVPGFCLIVAGGGTAKAMAAGEQGAADIAKVADEIANQNLFWRFVAVIAVWGGVMEFVRGVYIQSGMNAAGNELFLRTQLVDALLVAAVTIVTIVGVALIPRRFNFSKAYRLIFFISISGIILLPLARTAEAMMIPYALTMSAGLLVAMVLWVISIVFASAGSRDTIGALSCIRAFSAGGLLLGFLMARWCFSVVVASNELVHVVSLVAVLALAFCYLSVFTEGDVEELSRLFPSRRKDRFRQQCRVLAERYNLSKRELEIMMLLARGRNAGYIQDTLFISYNTVTTHRKHIYQKMGIHSQQELLDLLDGRDSR